MEDLVTFRFIIICWLYPDDGTGVKIYDLDQKEYVEDAVLDQFMQENYPVHPAMVTAVFRCFISGEMMMPFMWQGNPDFTVM